MWHVALIVSRAYGLETARECGEVGRPAQKTRSYVCQQQDDRAELAYRSHRTSSDGCRQAAGARGRPAHARRVIRLARGQPQYCAVRRTTLLARAATARAGARGQTPEGSFRETGPSAKTSITLRIFISPARRILAIRLGITSRGGNDGSVTYRVVDCFTVRKPQRP